MMLIDGEGEVYMLDRDNCVFKVFGLRFLHRKDLRRHLKNTLIDGVSLCAYSIIKSLKHSIFTVLVLAATVPL